MQLRTLGRSIPACRTGRDLVSPNPETKRVDQNQERDFRKHRAELRVSRVDCGVKAGHVCMYDKASLTKPSHCGSDARINYQFGADENRQCDQETNVRLYVVKERDVYRGSHRMPTVSLLRFTRCARQQLLFNRHNLIVDHSAEVQLTALRERNMLHLIREHLRMHRVFERRHQHEQRRRGFITRLTDHHH